ncbi:MAG: hypothetical protein EBT22_02310 [Chloroflexi bacterium]|nr:hypothetical protein [Chloroflexota bacterium]
MKEDVSTAIGESLAGIVLVVLIGFGVVAAWDGYFSEIRPLARVVPTFTPTAIPDPERAKVEGSKCVPRRRPERVGDRPVPRSPCDRSRQLGCPGGIEGSWRDRPDWFNPQYAGAHTASDRTDQHSDQAVTTPPFVRMPNLLALGDGRAPCGASRRRSDDWVGRAKRREIIGP